MMNEKKPKVYAVKHRNEEIRTVSRSGGIFTALSDIVLSHNGYVYGCILTPEFDAFHVRATTVAERNRMRGSKYIQSNMGNIYSEVFNDLQTGRNVLFSGTSCQIAGLKAYLGQEYDNLFCVDIVCHGVPSPLVWKKYLEWQEKRTGHKCVEADFRNKTDFGWSSHIETLTMDNGRRIHSEVFKILFYEHNILRPSCYKCPYKDIMHPGDITIADYWGINKATLGFDDDKGVSLVLVNNFKGSKIFNSVKQYIEYIETCIEDSMQPPLIKPFEEPLTRKQFWKDFYEKSFKYIAKKYAGASVKQDIKIIIFFYKRRIKKAVIRL